MRVQYRHQEANMKTWAKPKLISIVRGRPEEALLSGCKWHLTNMGPNYAYVNCQQDYLGPGQCSGDCSQMHAS